MSKLAIISSIFILKSYKKFTTNFGEMFIENNPTSHVKSSIELLRFSIHSIAEYSV